MEIEHQVVSVGLAKELKELGVKQDSIWIWVKRVNDKYGLVLEWDVDLRKETYSAYTVAEIDDMLPDHVKKGNIEYYLFITKTNKTESFALSEYYISYVDISYTHYLHSEREDKGVDAHAKMWIYLKKEGLIQ
jgi:hypothetical protein